MNMFSFTDLNPVESGTGGSGLFNLVVLVLVPVSFLIDSVFLNSFAAGFEDSLASNSSRGRLEIFQGFANLVPGVRSISFESVELLKNHSRHVRWLLLLILLLGLLHLYPWFIYGVDIEDGKACWWRTVDVHDGLVAFGGGAAHL
ncbi:hypothetical protein QQP08_012058 [Theobroma cacao]|nr:hypothetical protein QQP08_012058 [Theobroma cacao]